MKKYNTLIFFSAITSNSAEYDKRSCLPSEEEWANLHSICLYIFILKMCNENPLYVFLEKELRGLSPNFHIHVSVSDLNISRISPDIFMQQYRNI
jgi:hypothetical protein